MEDLRANSRRVSEIFERQSPPADQVLYSPSVPGIYHGLTYGALLDQLVRRVDARRRSVAQFFTDELATPLGIEKELLPATTRDMFYKLVLLNSREFIPMGIFPGMFPRIFPRTFPGIFPTWNFWE